MYRIFYIGLEYCVLRKVDRTERRERWECRFYGRSYTMNSRQRTPKRTSFPELLGGNTWTHSCRKSNWKQINYSDHVYKLIQVTNMQHINMLTALLFVSAVWELCKVVQPILQDLPGNPMPGNAVGMESATIFWTKIRRGKSFQILFWPPCGAQTLAHRWARDTEGQ